MSATAQIAELDSYLDAFAAVERRSPAQPDWLSRIRRHAFETFCDAGFPKTKDEDWRFTNVSPIANQPFVAASEASGGIVEAEVSPSYLSAPSLRLTFVDGRFNPQLSALENRGPGVTVSSLARAINDGATAVQAHLGRYVDTARDAFCSLNTALFEDGAYVEIAPGTVLGLPVHLLFVSTGSGNPGMVHARNLLIVGAHAQASILEEHVSLGTRTVFTNTVTELIADDNAGVLHHAVERANTDSFHISTLRIQQGRDARVNSHSVLIGGSLVRNNVHPVLAGEGGECLINGLYIGRGRQHLDNYMLVEHASPHCASHQFYNGILSDRAHGVFHGRILVHKDAQKTDAKQTNRNLLLSDDAQIDTKPQLEIYADDVKCTHGATIGQIDENSLFYLRSRGLDESTAREMLLLAFAGECLTRIQPGAIRDSIEQSVDNALLGASRYNRGTA